MKHKQDLTSGSITEHLLRLALPLILGNILQQMYNTIDALVIGRCSREIDFAAVGVASSIMNLLLFAIVGSCCGFSIIFSQLYGGKKEAAFRTEHFLTLTLGSLGAILLSLVSIALLPFLLQITCTPSQLLDPVLSYLRIVLSGLPFAFLYNLYSALLRSTGNTSSTLYILSLSVILNLGLDLFFVAELQLGIAGAAWATLLAQLVSALCSVICFYRRFPHMRCRRQDCRWDRALIAKTLRFGLVTGIHQSSLYMGKLLVQSAVNTAGTEIIAAYTAATRIEGFANSFGDSGASATSVVTAQNLGAQDEKRVKGAFRCSLLLLLLLGALCSLIMYMVSPKAVSIVLGQSSGIAFDQAVSYLRIIALFYTFCFTGNTFAGWLDGIGRVTVPFLGAAGHILLRVLLSWALISSLRLSGVAFATGIGWVLVNLFWSFFLLQPLSIHGKLKENIREQTPNAPE